MVNELRNGVPRPFLKWAGGKGYLVIEYDRLNVQ